MICCFKFLFYEQIQELYNGLSACKDEFKEFERQDVKYREDLKHMKQKIKKLEEKLEKVWEDISFPFWWACSCPQSFFSCRIH